MENKRLALTVHVVPIFQALADKGDADGQFRMGEFYRDGYGVPKDEAKARDYFTKSAAQGYKDAAPGFGEIGHSKAMIRLWPTR